MSKKVLFRLDPVSQKQKASILKSVSSVGGIDSIAIDGKMNTLHVVGDVDPVELLRKIRKIVKAELISIGPKTPEDSKTCAFDKSCQPASGSSEGKSYAWWEGPNAETCLGQPLEAADLRGGGWGLWLLESAGFSPKKIWSHAIKIVVGQPLLEDNTESAYPLQGSPIGKDQLEEEEYFSSEDQFTEDSPGNANIHEQTKYPHLEERTTQELEKLLLTPSLDPMDSIASKVSIIHTLDLSYTNIKSLPEFISKFVSLRIFNLKGCQLLMELVPETGELLNLEEFDLEGTEIICLPKEIAKLINLKSLKLTLCGCADQFQETKQIGSVIPQKALLNLVQLNELSIDVNPHGEWWNAEVKTVIDDLHFLQELRTLRLYIPTVHILHDMIGHSLPMIHQASARFRFTVGHHDRLVSRLPEGVLQEFDDLEKFQKGLKFTSGEGISVEIQIALEHMDAFLLERHWSIKNLLEFGLKNTDQLKCCILSECNELQTLVDTKQHTDYDGTILGSLQYLSIHYMKSMQKIWRGPVTKGSLSNLKSLALYTCVSLTTVFKLDMLANLTNLEELRIEDCPKIKALVSLNFSDSMSQDFLPKLKSMLLLELPNLRCISSGMSLAPKLERLVILYCPNLKKLSTTEISSKELQVLKGTKGWWDALNWYESDVTEADQNYLSSKFVPLREDGDLEEQFLRD